jgi:hypothetical protein
MRSSLVRLMLTLCMIAVSAFAYAQGSTTSSISGTVVDAGGGVIPGATVSVKSTATAQTFTAVTNNGGTFSVPALDAGSYSVTVALSGFKTAVISNVQLTVGTPASVKITLEVGSLSETVEVRGGAELVNTQTPTVSSTLNVDQINKMPMPTRNALNAVTFLPGVNTAGANRDSNFNGLPDSFVAISLDGVNNNDNYNKSSEGLFAMVTPRQDAVEAVTVTTAAAGADVGGHGAVQIAFVTRSGTNRFSGSAYEYHRDKNLNTNYYFNALNGLPKNDITLNQYGIRQGGPIVLPGLYNGRGKAFFFFNYEELRLPNNFTRTRVVLTPEARAGIFTYDTAAGRRTVSILDVARNAGFPGAADPTVARTLASIAAGVATTGVLNVRDENTQSYVWQSPGKQYEKQPVVKIDYNISSKHRLSGTYNWQVVSRNPDQLNGGDVRFPGAPNSSKYLSYRPLTSGALRSTLSANMVSELKGGVRWGPGYFGDNSSNGPQTFADTDGYALDLSSVNGALGITDWHVENNPTWRSASSWNIDHTITWQRGRHSVSFGGALFFGNTWVKNQNMVPSIQFGIASGRDPVDAIFSNAAGAAFAGASNAQLTDARELLALLTGRVTSIGGTAVLDEATRQYVYLGTRRQAGRQNEYSLFAQDSWRATPTLTINAGLRWDVQMPFVPVNDVLSTSDYADLCGVSGIGADGECVFYTPGASGGRYPQFRQFDRGNLGWNIDWNNLAPNVGVAWRPNVQTGILRKVLGDPDQSTLRAGYSVAYNREGAAVYTGQYGANPGSSLSVTRNINNANLVLPGENWPLLFSDRGRLGPGTFPATPTYPIAARPSRADSVNIFSPDIEVAYARTYNLSFQRALSRDMAIDIRWVGTRGVNQWTEVNYNERNIESNGFYQEFRLAQANLLANQAAGRGNTFAYAGAGTGTSPLPIYLAYFAGRTDASNVAAYTASAASWTNSTFVGRLARTEASPNNAASDLDGDATRRANAIAAGLAPNFFVLNPDVNQANVYRSDAYSGYDALQIEVRRRLSRGFQINGSYQYALETGSAYLNKRYGRVSNPTANVRHAIKMQWDWTVPVGRGQRFLAGLHPILDGVVGGWEFNGTGRVQARTLNFGNVRLIGMSVDELTDEYYYRINSETKIVTMLPDDIILNTRRAYSTSATTATGYSDLGVPEGRYIAPANSAECTQMVSGDCAPRTLLVRAPFFTRFDVSLGKKFAGTRRLNVEVKLNMLNVFDNINFNPAADPGTSATQFRSTSAYTDINNTFDPGGRVGELVFRINW